MAVGNILRIGLASVAVASFTLAGCASFRPVPSQYQRTEVSREPPSPPPAPSRIINGHSPFLYNVLFDHGKSDLKPEAKPVLDEVVQILKAHPQDTLTVTGHTSDPGEEAYNKRLGLQRAEKVKAYLVEQGIAPDRVSAKSAGESQPVMPNDSPANRALNRQAVFNFTIGGE